MMQNRRAVFTFILLCFSGLFVLQGCVSVGGIADNLAKAVVNQQDPVTVRDGAPAYLILLDSLILDSPDDSQLLLAAARLNSAYAGAFVGDPGRARLMTGKALDYARRALCEELEDICLSLDKPLDEFVQALVGVDDKDDLPVLYGFTTAWAGWVQAHSEDWQAIAALPKIQAGMEQILAIDDSFDYGNAHVYLGVLLTLRPAALGGQPEAGHRHFEKAIEISKGRNLMAKVLYAEKYARLVFDQELHDRLLNEVLFADAEAPNLTLINRLAQEKARALLESSKDYF